MTAYAADFSALLTSANAIDAQDVRRFRREVFEDGIVTRLEAEGLFALNDMVAETCAEWRTFFVEAMTDYLVLQAEPRGYTSVENAEWLISMVSHDGHICSLIELELLIHVLEKGTHAPQKLVAFTMEEVAHAVLAGNGEVVGNIKLTPGVLGKPEVELLRRIMYAYGGNQGVAISKVEAGILFDLNDRTVEAENDPAWSDLFVRAIASHLLAASGYSPLPREEMLRREAWVEDTEIDVPGMLAETLRSVGGAFSSIGDAFKSDHSRMQERWSERNSAYDHDIDQAEKIDGNEAQWLIERIGRDGVLHENEKALVRFIRDDSPNVHPDFEELVKKLA